MRSIRYFLVVLLLAGMSSMCFGWGNATHMYFAKKLGMRLGKMNLNEMYGSVLPDLTAMDPSESGQALYRALHENPLALMQVAQSCELKAVSFGFASHNVLWGADHTAHIEALQGKNPRLVAPGWVIGKAYALVPGIAGVLQSTVIPWLSGVPGSQQLYEGLALEFGHDLTETAVDLMVRRQKDPLIGLEMMVAAKLRPSSTGALLAEAFGFTDPVPKAQIIGAEQQYQAYIMQYGQLFTLPEAMTIDMLAESLVPVAIQFITIGLTQYGVPPEMVDQGGVNVDKETVKSFITSALQNVRNDYAREIDLTLEFVCANLRSNHVSTCWNLFAMRSEAELQGPEVKLAPETAAPTEYTLAGNYPNPFNPCTMIRFAIPTATQVSLQIYNALGEKVATLVDGQMAEGWHEVAWNATGLPSGVYFYRLQSGSFIETKRMMLLK